MDKLEWFMVIVVILLVTAAYNTVDVILESYDINVTTTEISQQIAEEDSLKNVLLDQYFVTMNAVRRTRNLDSVMVAWEVFIYDFGRRVEDRQIAHKEMQDELNNIVLNERTEE
jgi:hypothetical protein